MYVYNLRLYVCMSVLIFNATFSDSTLILIIKSEQITKIYSFQQLYRLFLGFPIVSN